MNSSVDDSELKSPAWRFIALDRALCQFGGMVGLLWYCVGAPFSLAILSSGTLSLAFGLYLSQASSRTEK